MIMIHFNAMPFIYAEGGLPRSQTSNLLESSKAWPFCMINKKCYPQWFTHIKSSRETERELKMAATLVSTSHWCQEARVIYFFPCASVVSDVHFKLCVVTWGKNPERKHFFNCLLECHSQETATWLLRGC